MIEFHVKVVEMDQNKGDLAAHVCPFCKNRWFEESDKVDWPNYCPDCGREYDVNKRPEEAAPSPADETENSGKKVFTVCYQATGGLDIEAESEDAARAEFENRLQEAMDELRQNSIEITEVFEGGT